MMTNDESAVYTWQSGPSDPPCHGDGPGTFVEVDIKAPIEVVWGYLIDIGFGADFSKEFQGARWADGFDGPGLEAQFIGANTHPAIGEWEVRCFVDRYHEPTEFGWVTSDRDNPGAQWGFTAAPIQGGTRLRYSLTLGPGPSGITLAIESMPDKEPRILVRRIDEHRANMVRVLEGIRARAEADAISQHPN